jgi:hypothetical protein
LDGPESGHDPFLFIQAWNEKREFDLVSRAGERIWFQGRFQDGGEFGF